MVFDNKNKNLKEEFKKLESQTVSLDYFLYACMCEEEENNRLSDRSDSAIKSCDLLSVSGKSNQEYIDSCSLENLVNELFSWYKEEKNVPNFAKVKKLNHEGCERLIKHIVVMINDLKRLVAVKTGANLEVGQNSGLWINIDRSLKSFIFGSYTSEYLRKICDSSISEDQDISSLPLQGQYFKRAQAKYYKSLKQRTQDVPLAREETSRQKTNKVYPKGDIAHNKRVKKSSEEESKQINEALAEVSKAVSLLVNTPNTKEWTLMPQSNSYIRRLQHQRASEAASSNGIKIKTESVGDDGERTKRIKLSVID